MVQPRPGWRAHIANTFGHDELSIFGSLVDDDRVVAEDRMHTKPRMGTESCRNHALPNHPTSALVPDRACPV